jgi:hypothetical protein
MGRITSLIVVLTLTFCVILASATSSGLLMVFAQSNQTKASSSTNQTKSSSSPSQSSSAASTPQQHITKIRITSPSRGQQLPVGKELTVYGTSIDNATSNDCKVSVIVNKVRPYQPATATGTGGPNDYSKWNFVLTSKYTTIKPGQNRITAKYECGNNAALSSHSSVNVTGLQQVATTTAPSSSTNQTKSSSSPSLLAVGTNQTAAKQQQPINNTISSSAGKNATSAVQDKKNTASSNPLANIPIIGRLFGGK